MRAHGLRVFGVARFFKIEFDKTSTKGWTTRVHKIHPCKAMTMPECTAHIPTTTPVLSPTHRVLNSLAKHMPFEIVAGLNGAFWVDSGETWGQRVWG